MKKILFLSLALTLSAGLWGINGVHYIDANGQEQTVDKVSEISNKTSTLKTGWYVVRGTDVKTRGLTCSGNVHLIIADGAKLTTTGKDKPDYTSGIQVSGEGNSLTIYGQKAQSGQLIANGGMWAAGIGGGYKGNGSNITINGGKVTATGGEDAAGIGGGNEGSGSNIIINGGTITAIGKLYSAGIGGGDDGSGSHITINGGAVTATGGSGGAGIGSGLRNWGSYITINGGTVTATGGDQGDGIGGGLFGKGNKITINGGVVTASGGQLASGISGSNTKVNHSFSVLAGNNNPPTEEVGIPRTDSTDLAGTLFGKRYAIVKLRTETALASVPYVDEYGDEKKANAHTIISSDTTVTWGKSGTTTWYYAINNAEVKLAQGAICNGDVRLILADEAKLTANGGSNQAAIQVSGKGNSLTIYGHNAQSGQLIATGGEHGAGIGGGHLGSNSNITINGGTIIAKGGNSGAGIGGGSQGSGSNITINRGAIEATGGYDGAGIGGGSSNSGSNIIIKGGTVTATGSDNSAGIGGGNGGNGFDIIIHDGTITAKGASYAAGIGGGAAGSGSNITIKGGTVTAIGGDKAAGIGGGGQGSGSNITINGGTVTAMGGERGAGIGGGYLNSSSNIFVSPTLCVKAGSDNPPTTEIVPTHVSKTDIAQDLTDKQYAIIEPRTEHAYIEIPYIDENDEEKNVWAYSIFSSNNPLTLGQAGQTTWYVVIREDDVRLTKGAVCNGDVRLILCDDSKLTITGMDNQAGIQVFGEGNSLTIYGQAEQTGLLKAIGGNLGAGIGGNREVSGSNITINGGIVIAEGGLDAAGIGGGVEGSGSNITINGGVVFAQCMCVGSAIGGGWRASSSNIKVAAGLVALSDDNNPPKTIIAPTHTAETDIANGFAGKLYATVFPAPTSIAIKTPPTKVRYLEGHSFDPTGLVLKATYSDGTTEDIPFGIYAINFSFIPTLDDALQMSDTQVTITYGGYSCTQPISVDATKLLSVAVKTAPTRVEYNVGEHFDPAGLVITAEYNNNIPVDIAYNEHASDFTFSPALDAALQMSATEVTITYGGYSCTQTIIMFNKEAALAEIYAAMEGNEDSEYLNGLVATQITAIQNATTVAVVTANKEEAIAIIQSALSAYKAVLTEGYKRAKDELPTDAQDAKGPIVIVTKGEKTLKLVNPDFVEYDKQ